MQRHRLPDSASQIRSREGFGSAIEQRLGGDQDAGRAVAALRAAEVGKAVLQRVQTAVAGQPFNGRDLAPLALGRQQQAREHRLAIDQHGACAALAQLAAVLGAGELQIFSQHLEQRLVAVGQHIGGFAVDRAGEADLHDRDLSFWLDRTTDSVRFSAGDRLAMPRTRKREMTSPTATAVSGPSGRNQVTVQFMAPSMARATMRRVELDQFA